ncbi:uncharacterized protein ARMOST_02497 [Armillaria ostoyae]|uniref:Uncharacterized protein n=1 Tax=Armillaria ostoyae TaxID=47428 RepID=A0A284QRW4_ARMOS|nr:uncharacterized protein ARMOST_02497 [Armillaria ostoyae]
MTLGIKTLHGVDADNPCYLSRTLEVTFNVQTFKAKALPSRAPLLDLGCRGLIGSGEGASSSTVNCWSVRNLRLCLLGCYCWHRRLRFYRFTNPAPRS